MSLATAEARRLYGDWLGRDDIDAVAIANDLPWCAPGSAMEVESLIAHRAAGQYWRESPAQPAIARGLSWYLQSRVVEHLFNLKYALPGHSSESVRLFGGFVPVTLPALRISRWRSLDVPARQRRRPPELDEASVRAAMAFASLERYVGWPVLQGALAVLARDRDAPLTAERTRGVISAAAGEDLTWFFDIAFDGRRTVEYAIAGFGSSPASSCAAAPCFTTQVILKRLGNAAFSGSSRDRVGRFDSGTAIGLRVGLESGQIMTARWDGRDDERTFLFESPTPGIAAQLDPDGVLLLDPNRQDHWWRLQAASNVSIAKWVARWSVWLQHAMMSYAMLV